MVRSYHYDGLLAEVDTIGGHPIEVKSGQDVGHDVGGVAEFEGCRGGERECSRDGLQDLVGIESGLC